LKKIYAHFLRAVSFFSLISGPLEFDSAPGGMLASLVELGTVPEFPSISASLATKLECPVCKELPLSFGCFSIFSTVFFDFPQTTFPPMRMPSVNLFFLALSLLYLPSTKVDPLWQGPHSHLSFLFLPVNI
jgi:hypothetical protein